MNRYKEVDVIDARVFMHYEYIKFYSQISDIYKMIMMQVLISTLT